MDDGERVRAVDLAMQVAGPVSIAPACTASQGTGWLKRVTGEFDVVLEAANDADVVTAAGSVTCRHRRGLARPSTDHRRRTRPQSTHCARVAVKNVPARAIDRATTDT
ncbi:hypothetical protein [Prauserella cavernicola]|uniref:Uncharacterized protein n=1 Tax=Prauserella cavernicola TaxID=2800127 RepID=A0A934V7S7_9PSEU|nr:hypothetical protein [Prauserella cavernicola]MBK1788004.1 hypothetical protein [Prauserella cavernicola]